MDLKAHTARDTALRVVRIPLGAGRLVAKRIPAPVGPTVCKVIDTVDSLLPHGAEAHGVGAPGGVEARREPVEPTPAAAPAAPVDEPVDAPEPPVSVVEDALAEEAAAAQEAAGGEEVRTPAGTPAADVGFNPDTAETDLEQPGTEPLMDPSTTKKVASEAQTLSKAADPQKE